MFEFEATQFATIAPMPLHPRARIAIVGEFDPTNAAHQAIPLALAYAAEQLSGVVEHEWIATDTLAHNAATRLAAFNGIWCVPGGPYASFDGIVAAIHFAHETGRPCLGARDDDQPAAIDYGCDAQRGKLNPIVAAFVRTAQEQQA